MSRTGLITSLLTICFILFSRVTSFKIPYWLNNEYRFSCESVCSDTLKGETFSCLMASYSGLAAGRIVIRLLPNFDWRYYAIHEMEFSKEFCRSVLIADQFYSTGNQTRCHTLPPKISAFNFEVARYFKVFAGPLPLPPVDNIKVLNSIIQKEPFVGLPFAPNPLKTYKQNWQDRFSGNTQISPNARTILSRRSLKSIRKFSDGINDPRTDALCLWISANMCDQKQIVTCIHDYCCRADLNPLMCEEIQHENGINKYRENVYQTIQATKQYRIAY